VPKRYTSVDARRHVFTALHTDSLEEAKKKEPGIIQLQTSMWEAHLAGRGEDATRFYDELRTLAEMQGFVYSPARTLAAGNLSEIIERSQAVGNAAPADADVLADAILGAAVAPVLSVSGLLDRAIELTPDRMRKYSPDQMRRWRNARQKAIKNFVSVVGNVRVESITRSHVLKFRNWWWVRVEAGEVSADTANKDFSHLGALLKVVSDLEIRDLKNPFHGVRFEAAGGKGLPFSQKWIREKLLCSDAFDGLNDQARDILLTMFNTGARPSEIAALQAVDIHLAHNIPYIEIQPEENRRLKTPNSRRSIPLVGVSLEAMRRHPDGFPRYRGKPSSWSNLVMKFLRGHGLLETEKHKAYSLRHSFQDALQNLDCPDRTRKELMGHAIDGVVYGHGASLENKAEWLAKIAY